MRNITKISKLIEFIIDDKENSHSEITIGKVTKRHSSIFYKTLKVHINKSAIVIDSSAIRHAMRKHSNTVREFNRGQIAVTYNDFEHIPNILAHPGRIEYKGKNNLKQDVFMFIKQLDNLYLVAMCVRPSKFGTKLVFGTIYIRKTKKPA